MNTKTMEERLCELTELEDLWDEIRECGMLDQKNYNIHAIEDVSYIAYWTLEEGANYVNVDHPSDGYVSDDNEYQLHQSVRGYKEILIILESPHINDYTYALDSEYEMSPTLETIEQYRYWLFCCLIYKNVIRANEHYIIRVVDPVPYMASLGREQSLLENKIVTYRVWNAIWEKLGYRDKFIQKVSGLPYGSIVLNACTNRQLPEEIRINKPKICIQQATLLNMNCASYYSELVHPASILYERSIRNMDIG